MNKVINLLELTSKINDAHVNLFHCMIFCLWCAILKCIRLCGMSIYTELKKKKKKQHDYIQNFLTHLVWVSKKGADVMDAVVLNNRLGILYVFSNAKVYRNYEFKLCRLYWN